MRLLGVLTTALVMLLSSVSAAHNVASGTFRWPHAPLRSDFAAFDFSTIYYFDASAFSWSVERAVDAWNDARTGYRFERLDGPYGAAVIVKGAPDGSKKCDAHARPGFPLWKKFNKEYPREVRLMGRCDRYLMVLVAAHELGHVLGLSHVPHNCALMSKTQGKGGRFSTPLNCPQFPPREWWRKPVRPDDIRGVKKLYYDDAHDPMQARGAPQ